MSAGKAWPTRETAAMVPAKAIGRMLDQDEAAKLRWLLAGSPGQKAM
jgi:hypothetical protein